MNDTARRLAASLLALCLAPAATLGGVPKPVDTTPTYADYPDDPFADDRQLLRPSEIGATRGQVQFSALGALVQGGNSPDIYLGGKLGLEFMLDEFGAVRITGFQDLVEADGQQLAHKSSSARVGPALHLRPWKRVDLGPYLEGGVVVVDAVDGRTGAKAAEVALGGFITVHVDSFLFIRMELERAWTNVEVNNVVDDRHRTAALLGLGIAF
jgi:hypothetical protein